MKETFFIDCIFLFSFMGFNLNDGSFLSKFWFCIFPRVFPILIFFARVSLHRFINSQAYILFILMMLLWSIELWNIGGLGSKELSERSISCCGLWTRFSHCVLWIVNHNVQEICSTWYRWTLCETLAINHCTFVWSALF